MKFKSRFGLTALMGCLTQGVLAALILLAFLLVSKPVLADLSGKFCTKTSLNMLESCKFGAGDDYWVAIAKCNNLPTHAERETCKRQASKDLKSAKEDCSAQFTARQQICKVLGQDVYNPIINPADFVDGNGDPFVINNPFFSSNARHYLHL